MIRCFITVVPVEKKMRGQSKPKKRKKRKKTLMTKTDKFLFTTHNRQKNFKIHEKRKRI